MVEYDAQWTGNSFSISKRLNLNIQSLINPIIHSGCIATCDQNYKFPNGVKQLAIICIDKQWRIVGTDWNSVPHCEREYSLIIFTAVRETKI